MSWKATGVRRFSQRRSITIVVAGLLTVGAVAQCDEITSVRRRQEQAPNVLLIVTDDQRRALPMMQETRRWFVEGGRRFPNAHTTIPVCCPARAGIFTGRYTHNHGVETNLDADRLIESQTFQYALKEHGYVSAIFGKYLNSANSSPPNFDYWTTHLRGPRYYGLWDVNGQRRSVDVYSTDYIVDRATRFLDHIEDQDDRPWLLYVPVSAPHAPFTVPERYVGADVAPWRDAPPLERDRRDKPAWVRGQQAEPNEGAQLRQATIRALMPVDDLVHTLLRAVEELGEDERTLAIFTSDHGRMWGEHGLTAKQVPYSEAVRVPLMIRWTGRVEPGSVDRRLVTNMDVAPTILEAAGVEHPERALDGRSLLDRSWRRDHVLIEFFHQEARPGPPTWASLRSRTFQYTEYYADDGTVEFREYYALRNDPHQLHNLLGDASADNDPSAATLRDLEERLAEARACSGPACP